MPPWLNEFLKTFWLAVRIIAFLALFPALLWLLNLVYQH